MDDTTRTVAAPRGVGRRGTCPLTRLDRVLRRQHATDQTTAAHRSDAAVRRFADNFRMVDGAVANSGDCNPSAAHALANSDRHEPCDVDSASNSDDREPRPAALSPNAARNRGPSGDGAPNSDDHDRLGRRQHQRSQLGTLRRRTTQTPGQLTAHRTQVAPVRTQGASSVIDPCSRPNAGSRGLNARAERANDACRQPESVPARRNAPQDRPNAADERRNAPRDTSNAAGELRNGGRTGRQSPVSCSAARSPDNCAAAPTSVHRWPSGQCPSASRALSGRAPTARRS